MSSPSYDIGNHKCNFDKAYLSHQRCYIFQVVFFCIHHSILILGIRYQVMTSSLMLNEYP